MSSGNQKPFISLEEILQGAMQLGMDAWKGERTIEEQLEWSNGSAMADMDYVIFKGDEDLFWMLRRERSKLDESRAPYTREYIDGYNRKALEYGMPEHHHLSS